MVGLKLKYNRQLINEANKMMLKMDWKVICASVVGSFHKKNKLPLQDYGLGKVDPFPILVIADGAGSEVNSATGAEIAVKTSLDYIISNTFKINSKKECVELYEEILKALKEKAYEIGTEVSTFATTIIIVYVLDMTVYWMQLGDGVIIAKKNGFLSCVSLPFRGEFANETVFVTSYKASEFLQYGVFPVSDCDGILAFTDGLSPALIYQNSLVPAPVCSSLIEQLMQKPLTSDDLHNLINDDLSDVSGDDKTLGLLVPITKTNDKSDEFPKKNRQNSKDVCRGIA